MMTGVTGVTYQYMEKSYKNSIFFFESRWDAMMPSGPSLGSIGSPLAPGEIVAKFRVDLSRTSFFWSNTIFHELV